MNDKLSESLWNKQLCVYLGLLYVQLDSNDCHQTCNHIVGTKGVLSKPFS